MLQYQLCKDLPGLWPIDKLISASSAKRHFLSGGGVIFSQVRAVVPIQHS